MNVERIGRQHAFVPSLIGFAMLAIPSATWSQQQGQSPQQGQGQGQEDVQVAVAPEAQQPQEQMIWNEVRVVHVKPDRAGEFEGLIKELGAVMSEQGGPGFNVWQVAFGPQSTYHIVAQLESFASIAGMEENPPMDPQEWANWVNRIESTIDHQTLSVAQIHQDLSIMPQAAGGQAGAQAGGQAGGQAGAQSGAEEPELLILMSQTLMPGKRQEYVTWLRDEMLPALRESDIMGVVSNEMAFGAEGRTWVFAVPVQSWSELDQPMPLYRSMGREAADQLMSRGESMVERSETIVLRTRPDLSVMGAQPGQQQSQQAGQQQRQQGAQ